MKVRVTYTTTVTEEVEVDDEFQSLRWNDPRYDNLTLMEANRLSDRLIKASARQVCCCSSRVVDIVDCETGDLLAEN
jgi:hypothetical protein